MPSSKKTTAQKIKPKKSEEIKQLPSTLPNCCSTKSGLCQRHSDKKPFDLTNRKYSKKECTTEPIKGFTMRSSCAPFKDCKNKK
jgi:hypothetical protein